MLCFESVTQLSARQNNACDRTINCVMMVPTKNTSMNSVRMQDHSRDIDHSSQQPEPLHGSTVQSVSDFGISLAVLFSHCRRSAYEEGVQEATLRIAQRAVYDNPRAAGGPDVFSESAR